MAVQYQRACRLLGAQLEGSPIVVACSGGADSAAALLLARAVATRGQLIACYVDHGLRPPQSIARDIKAVRAQAKSARASVRLARIPRIGTSTSYSREEAARNARYRVLEAVARRAGSSIVISGHQRDDLVETSLLALARGSGVDGVAAMRPKRPLSASVSLVRPLLWATKAQCVEFVRSRGVPYSEDETNSDTRIPRNAVRGMLAQLERALPRARRGIARSAALIADDRILLDGLTAKVLSDSMLPTSGEFVTAVLRRLPIALVRRAVRHALRVRGASLRNFAFEHCDAIARAIKDGRGGRYHAGASTVVLSSGKLVVETENAKHVPLEPVRIDLRHLASSYSTPFGQATLARRKRSNAQLSTPRVQQLDLAALADAGSLELRAPRKGDVCIPSGRHREMSLARFLSKAGVPQSRRRGVVLLCAGGRIAAALGVRVMAPFAPQAGKSVLEVRWQAAPI
jgi:tRNA(Ile)-lysidine synthase